MNNLLDYSPNREYKIFPGDSIIDMKDIVQNGSRGIEKTTVIMPDVMPAIATIYKSDGAIDYEVLDDMLSLQSEAGIEAVLIAGTTGESSFMSHEEHIEYVTKAVNLAKKYGLKVLAGSGSNSTKEQNFLNQGVFDAGADASLLLAPYYIKASDIDIVRHLVEGLNSGPAIIYSIGGRTGCPISSEVIEILSEHPNFLGVKQCDGPEKISELVAKGIKVWTGNDDTSYTDIHREGASGSISVVCNIDPTLILEITQGQKITKSKIDRLLDLSNLLFLPGQPNPKPVHNTIEMIRRSVENIQEPATFRLPGGPLNNEQQDYLSDGLSKLGIESEPFYDNYKLIT